jgi:hypothetical protein
MKWSSVESGTDGQQRSSVMVDADDATEAALTTERICLPPKMGWTKVASYSALTVTCDSRRLKKR